MAHDNYMLLISLDLDGMITERQREDLRQHARACAHCAVMWEQMRLTDSMLKVQPEIAPPRDFGAKVMGRVQTYETRRRWTPWLMIGLAGLAVGVLVSIALPVVVVAFELYKPLLTWPVIGTALNWIARGYAFAVELIRLGIRDLLRWLNYLATEPSALAVVVTGLTIAATWIGLLEVTKSQPMVETARQQA